MKIKPYMIILLVYLIAFISIKTNLNLFYPYYLIKDLIYFPVQAITKDITLSDEVEKGIKEEKDLELEELKKLNNLSNTLSEFDKVSALVIERNKMYWFNTLTINKGNKDGIKEDMAVITGDGLIGRINKVSHNTSEVKLITTNDKYNKISVSINLLNDTIYGLLSSYNNEENYLEITSINKQIEIPKDSLVYTSGMGGVFPSGILIGKVSDTILDKYETSKIVKVIPSANINTTRFVNVLIRK